MKNLYLSEELAPGMAIALQELVGGRIIEVSPSLQTIFIQELEPSAPFQENIGQFVAARQLSDHPIVHFWLGKMRCSLYITAHALKLSCSSCIALAAQEEPAVARLASPLTTYSFLLTFPPIGAVWQ